MFWFIPIGNIGSIIGFASLIAFLLSLAFPDVREILWKLIFAERDIDNSIEESAYIKEYQRGYDDGLHQKAELDVGVLAYQEGFADGQKDRSILKEREDIA